MTFLQPFILWALPLILLPVIIHLLNRMRHRPQPWAAMRFLVSASRSSVSNARLRQWLILMFRVLAVLMLILFLSRPLAGGWLGWALSPAPDAVLILLDRSASMESRMTGADLTKREQALESLAQAAREFEEASHLILIESALRTPQEIGRGSRLSQLPQVAATDTAADMPAMLSSALNWLVENRAGTAEIWIASDLQRSNWHPEDPRWESLIAQFSALPQRVRFRLLAFDEPGGINRSISLQEMARRSRGAQSELLVALDIQANAAAPETIPVLVNLDGTRTQLDLRMESQALRWRHRLQMGNHATSGWGSFELPADANRRDNAAYFVYGLEAPLRASVISEGNPGARLLQFAIDAGARGSAPVATVISPAELGRAIWEDNSLLVWLDPLPEGAVAQRIRNFIEEGGTVLFLPPGRNDPRRFEGLGWGQMEMAGPERTFRIARWDEDHGPLAKSDEGLSLPLSEVTFQQRQSILGEKHVLAAFIDGAPFLARRTLGRGEVFFCASLPEQEWSSLGDGPVLVPMVQRLLQSGSRRMHQATSINCGDLGLADQGRRWESVDGNGSKEILTEAGVYRSGDRLLAVNRPSAEDDPEILEAAVVRELFGDLAIQMLHEGGKGGNLQGEIWRMFLVVMLLFLVAEAVLILPARPAVSQAARGHPKTLEAVT
jgi:hypothetical protein